MTGAARRPRWAWPAAAGVLAAALMVSAGCAGLPERTDVQQGLEVNARILPPLRVQFDPPPPGASREEVVRRFLLAGSPVEEGGAAARAFMTAEAWDVWSQREEVTIFGSPDRLTIAPLGASSVLVTVSASAEVDADGRYRELPAGSLRRSRLELAKESGEWRISTVDQGFGIWVQRFYFDLIYRPFQIAYVSATGPSIVVDHRWFPLGNAVGTSLARTQLEPVPGYLAGAAVSGVPPGTRLGVDSVGFEDQTAVVELSEQALDASAQERRAMWAQLLATMTQIPRVSGVSLRVDARRLDLTGGPQQPTSLAELGFTRAVTRSVPAVLVRRGEDLVVLDQSDLTGSAGRAGAPGRAPALPAVPVGWDHLAASADLQHLAAVSGDRREFRTWTVSPTSSSSAARLGSDLVDPSFDEVGVWTAGRDRPGATRVWFAPAADRAGKSPARPVEAPWLAGRRVQALRLSPDGTRALVLSTGRTGPSIGLSGVVRGPDRIPLSLRPPLPLGGSLIEARDATWVSDETVAVIGRRSLAESLGAIVVHLDGRTESLPALTAPVSIQCLGGMRGLLVRTGDGRLRVLAGSGWSRLAKIDTVIVPGA